MMLRPVLWRWEMRVLVAIPLLFLLTALATSYIGIELTLWALGRGPVSPAQSLTLQKVRLGLIGLGSAGALVLGFLLAMTVARPLRRMGRMARTRLEAVSPAPLGPARANELADLSNALNDALRAFDKLVADSHIVEGIPEGVLVVDRQGRIKRANAEARRLLGAAEGSVEGQELTQLVSPEASQALAHALRRVRETGAAVELPPVPALEPAGAGRELSAMLTPFPPGGRGEVLVTLKDVTRIPESL